MPANNRWDLIEGFKGLNYKQQMNTTANAENCFEAAV